MASFKSSASLVPTPQEKNDANFAMAVVDPNQNIYGSVDQVSDDKTIVTASCFCHSGYLTFGSRYYIRNPQVDPGDAFAEYDDFSRNLGEWLAKTLIISPVTPGAPTYNKKTFSDPHSRIAVFALYQVLFQDFFKKCEEFAGPMNPRDVKTILQSVFNIQNIFQNDQSLGNYLGIRQFEMYHISEPSQAEPLSKFVEMLSLKRGLTDRVWKLRGEPLCELEFSPYSYRELILIVQNSMPLPPNVEFSGYFPESIIDTANPNLSKNLVTMPTDMDLSDLISVRSWLRQYVRSISVIELNVDNFMVDINKVRQTWNIEFRDTPLEVKFSNPGFTRIVICTNLFMRLLEGMLLFFLTTIDRDKSYTPDPVLTNGKKLSAFSIFELLDHFKNIRMWTVTHGCQGIETSSTKVRLHMVKDILSEQSQSLLSQQLNQMVPSQLSQEDKGFLVSLFSGASKLLNKCTDALSCMFGSSSSSNCSISRRIRLYNGEEPGGSAAASKARSFEDQELRLATRQQYTDARGKLLQILQQQEAEASQRQNSQAEASQASSSGYGSSSSFSEEDIPIETQLSDLIDYYERRQSQSQSQNQAFGVPGEAIKSPGVELKSPPASAVAEVRVEEPFSKSEARGSFLPIQPKIPTTSKQSNLVPNEYFVSKELNLSPEEARLQKQQQQQQQLAPLRMSNPEGQGFSLGNAPKLKKNNILKKVGNPNKSLGSNNRYVQAPETIKLGKYESDFKNKSNAKLNKVIQDAKTEEAEKTARNKNLFAVSDFQKIVHSDLPLMKQAAKIELNLRNSSKESIQPPEEKIENLPVQDDLQSFTKRKRPKTDTDTSTWEGGRSKTKKHKRRQQQTKKNPKKKRTVNKRRQHKKRRTNKH